MKILIFFAVILLVATTAFGAGSSDILGIWRTEQDESKVEIFRCGEKLCGKIVWLKNAVKRPNQPGQPLGQPHIF